MNAEIKAEWVADLRANPKLQGKQQLKTDSGLYCCLGRLCVIATKHGIVQEDDWTEFFSLPTQVCKWAGLRYQNNPGIVVADRPDIETLSAANDRGLTFLEIADLIESQL